MLLAALVFIVVPPPETGLPVRAETDLAASNYEWEITEEGGLTWVQTTVIPEVDLPSTARRITARVRAPGGEWSGPSLAYIGNHCPGDLTWDGIVGVADFALVGQHFGEVCQ